MIRHPGRAGQILAMPQNAESSLPATTQGIKVNAGRHPGPRTSPSYPQRPMVSVVPLGGGRMSGPRDLHWFSND